MSLINFSKDEQRKSICFWYEVNTKGKKYAKSLTWREFKGKSYIKTQSGMNQVLKNYDNSGRIKRTIKKIQQNEPEIFPNLFCILKKKINCAKTQGLQNVHN